MLRSEVIPSHLIDDGSVLTDLSDARPPTRMESADSRTIRVMRLVEIFALGVPEIREVFQSIDGPSSMTKFERILLKELNREDVQIERLAYNLARILKMPILHLPMMRERYLSSLSPEQFEGLRRIISCMSHIELVVGARYMAFAYIDYALKNPDEIELMSSGLQALTRLYKKFQQEPIISGDYHSVARYRTMVGFLPAFVVFGSSGRDGIDSTQLRQGLEWIMGHEWEFDFPQAPLHELVSRKRFRLEEPSLRNVSEFHGGRFPEFDEMIFAIDRLLRNPRVGRLYWHQTHQLAPDSLGRLGLSLPKKIFAAAMRMGGMEAIETPLRTELLRIVPLFVRLITAIANRQIGDVAPPSLYRVQRMLDGLKPTDLGQLHRELDILESVIPPPQINVTL